MAAAAPSIEPPHLVATSHFSNQPEWTHDSISRTESFIRDSRDAAPDQSPDQVDDRNRDSATQPLREANLQKFNAAILTAASRPTRSRMNPSAPKSPTKPVFHARAASRDTVLPTEILTSQGTPASLKVTANFNDARPHLKRAPASHSSYGIETTNGPPPSFSTQQSLSQDRSWKPAAPESLDVQSVSSAQSKQTTARSPTRDAPTLSPSDSNSPGSQQLVGARSGNSNIMDVQVSGPSSIRTVEEDKDRTLRVLDGVTDDEGKGSSSGSREDLFLNLARKEEETLAQSRTERRRSRIGTSFPPQSPRVNASQERDFQSPTLSPDTPKPSSQLESGLPLARSSLNTNHHAPLASSHPLDEPNRMRYFTSSRTPSVLIPRSTIGKDSREVSPESPQSYKRRFSNVDQSVRNYRSSNLAAVRANRLVSASATEAGDSRYTDNDKARVDGTESTISTTAPSTVWDELDDLKSRIKKLELTGKLPPSSAAAMSTAATERPRTATTTVTTMSSSPKHGMKNEPIVEASVVGVPSTVHPLLQEALAKARSTVGTEVYQKLEATASDALQLATMMGGGGAQSSSVSVIGGSSSAERQAKRKADSMCRGLTELAIALSAQSPRRTSTTARPLSRDVSSPAPLDSSRFRLSSQEPEERNQPTPRVQSRLDARRSSLLHGRSQLENPNVASPESINRPSSQQSQTQRPTSSRLNRNVSLRNRRTHGLVDGQDDEVEEESPNIRPVSRAMTEIGNSSYKYSPRDRTSFGREYTSRHPLPLRELDSSPRSPSVATSNIPTRRAYGNTSNLGSSPLTQTTTSPNTATTASGLRRYGTNIRSSAMNTVNNSTYNSPTTALPQSPMDCPSSPLDDPNSLNRTTSIRQRLGIAGSRIGTSVGSRLRATKEARPELEKERRISNTG